jgi:predicted SnoaL-like aldol condensation-catalyzing enzyme
MRRLVITIVGALLGCSSPSAEKSGAVATAGMHSSGAAGQIASGGQGGSGASAGTAAIAGMSAIAGTGAGASGASGSGATGGMDAAMPPEAGADAGSDGAIDGGTPAASCDPELTRANRALVARAIDELFVDKDITAVDRHWADPYHQHNPIARSGVSTFRSLMSSIVSSPSFTYERLLTLADCDLVVVYGRYSQTGVIFDMFRVRDDKIMEHWDSDAGQASQVGQLATLDEDGASAESRALFASFSEAVLLGGEPERSSELLSATYVEHHGMGATGPAAFAAFLEAESVSYARVHHVIADGNYVFALSEGARGAVAYGFYDLFRVEAGKLAEHWDSRRAVPSSTMSGLGIF